MTHISNHLAPYADALVAAGFTVHLGPTRTQTVKHVFVTHPELPGVVLVEEPHYASLGQSPHVLFPVAPSREYGSAVMIDFEGGPEELVRLLGEKLTQTEVTTRFIDPPKRVRVRRDHLDELEVYGATDDEVAR